MPQKVILLTGYDHFFGQQRKPWVSLNTPLVISEINKRGYEVTELQFHQICNQDIDWSDSVVFYTFSQRDYLRQYIRDTIYHLQRQGCKVIPAMQLLHCHENKGYQELLKKELGITELPAKYFSSKRELADYNITYPVVLKTVQGSNGKGVYLIKDSGDLYRTIASLEKPLSFWTKLDLLRRKYLRGNKRHPYYEDFHNVKDAIQYKDYITPEICFILQDFIPNLQYDYRVIIFGEHYFVTKRMTRKGDFRASGTKRFTFDFVASDELLDYAQDIYQKMDTPFLSLDIGVTNGKFVVFEFQAIHFGVNTIIRGSGYYHNAGKEWEFVTKKSILESEFAYGLDWYLDMQQAHQQ